MKNIILKIILEILIQLNDSLNVQNKSITIVSLMLISVNYIC